MRIRLLLLDLDGTLVGAENTVSPAVREAIGRYQARGGTAAICTGRSRPATEPVAAQLGLAGWTIVSNGAVAMRLDTREVLCRNFIDEADAFRAVRIFIDSGIPPQVYEDAVERDRVLYHPEHPVRILNPRRYQPWPRLADELPFRPICVGSFGEEEALRPVAERLARELPHCYIDQSGTHDVWGVGVFHASSGKANSARRLAEHLGVLREEVMAIGDHLNDIEMLRWAGTGVAMGNALPEVKAAADWLTGSLSDDGVAAAIERILGA